MTEQLGMPAYSVDEVAGALTEDLKRDGQGREKIAADVDEIQRAIRGDISDFFKKTNGQAA